MQEWCDDLAKLDGGSRQHGQLCMSHLGEDRSAYPSAHSRVRGCQPWRVQSHMASPTELPQGQSDGTTTSRANNAETTSNLIRTASERNSETSNENDDNNHNDKQEKEDHQASHNNNNKHNDKQEQEDLNDNIDDNHHNRNHNRDHNNNHHDNHNYNDNNDNHYDNNNDNNNFDNDYDNDYYNDKYDNDNYNYVKYHNYNDHIITGRKPI
mmetsp:Transcript_21453/g.39468  ORF Transcript_21453/g.39468 Transcript_21453/m.39468 type:complete len:210 (-) Transcript_21453:211-840(-)